MKPDLIDQLQGAAFELFIAGHFAGAQHTLRLLRQVRGATPAHFLLEAACMDRLGEVDQALALVQGIEKLVHDERYRGVPEWQAVGAMLEQVRPWVGHGSMSSAARRELSLAAARWQPKALPR